MTSSSESCRLYQLVWRTGKLFSYDTVDFDDVKQLATPLQVRSLVRSLPLRTAVKRRRVWN